MHGVKRCYRLLFGSSKCILNARTFSSCSKLCGADGPLYCATARNGRMSVTANLFCRQPQTPFVFQCLKFSQESKARKIRRAIPDELWAILLVGVGGVCLFAVSEYNKFKLGKKKPPELEVKLKMAKKKAIDGQKGESLVLLKEALNLIHEYLDANPEPLKEDEQDKGKVKTHKYLKYVLDQLANLSFEQQKWSEAEHYFRLLLRNVLSSGTPKDDNSVVEISLKLSIACAHQDKQDLALQGFMWCTDTMERKINRSADTSEDSKVLLGLCLEGWGTYLLCQDKPSQAADLLSRALIVSKEVLGEDHEQTAVILNNLAKACAESGKYELAEDMAREAIQIAEKTKNSHHQRYLANLGAILNLKGNVLKAKEALLKALKVADDAKDEETKEMVNDSLTALDTNL